MARRPTALVALAVVLAAALTFRFVGSANWPPLELGLTEGLLKLLLWVMPCTIAVMALNRVSLHESWRELGLDDKLARGYRFGLVATIPMALLVLFGALGRLDSDEVVGSVLLGPFAEEVLFRGFLFRQLHGRAGWRPPAAMAASAVMFGLAHLGGFGAGGFDAVMLMAGGWVFAWICFRWGSLWPAIGLHAFINLWWDLSYGGPRARALAVAPGVISLGHVLSIALAILLTVRLKRPAAKNTKGLATR